MKRLAFALPILGLTLAFTESDAHALGPVDLEAGLKVGAATNSTDTDINPFGFGLGARGGVSIFNLYLGVSAIHYFGSSDTIAGVDTSVSSTLLGGEIGYTIKALPLVQLRPQIGVGTAIFNSSAEGTLASVKVDSSNSEGHLYLEPGLTVLVPLGLLYVGADANALILPGVDTATATGTESKTYTGFSLHGQIGITL